MTIPSITPLPAAPDPAADTPSVFSNKAAAFVLAQKAMSVELGATIPAMNSAVSQVNTDASTASSAAGTATDKATEAAASAASAANAPGTNATSTTSVAIPTSLPATFSLTVQPGKSFLNQYLRATATASTENYVEGDIASYNSATGALVLNVRQSQGVGTYAAWSVSLAAPRLVTVSNSIVQKTAAFTAVAADIGRMFECTGTFTMGIDAVASLPDGWYCYVTNISGTLTIDPNGSEKIHGANTIQPLSGDTFLIASDGAALKARKLGGRQTVMLTSGTSWTPPYDCLAKLTLVAGGASASTSTSGSTQGGVAGGAAIKTLALKRAVTYSTAIGAGGAGNAAGTNLPGQPGGTTSFSGSGITTITCAGAALATGGDINMTGYDMMISSSYGGKSIFPGSYGSGTDGPSINAASPAGQPGVIMIEF